MYETENDTDSNTEMSSFYIIPYASSECVGGPYSREGYLNLRKNVNR